MSGGDGARPGSGRLIGDEALRRLRSYAVCVIEPGFTARELARVEKQFGFEFADDHRAVLSAGPPVNRALPRPGMFSTHAEPWPGWRHDDRARLPELLARPTEGILPAAKRGYWTADWGPRARPRRRWRCSPPRDTSPRSRAWSRSMAMAMYRRVGHR
jgi:hypothetical protein